MDENTQNTGPVIMSSPQEKKKFNPFLLGLGIFVFAILIVVIVLNFFNIFSISKLFTANFGLENNNNKTQGKTLSSSPTPKNSDGKSMLPKVGFQPSRRNIPFISCPVSIEACKEGEPIVQDVDGKKIYGLKFNVMKNSPIFASVPGKKTFENHTSFSIDSPERGMKVKYITSSDFIPNSVDDSKVEEKDELGSFTGEKNILTIFVTATITKESVRIGIGPNGQYLTNQN